MLILNKQDLCLQQFCKTQYIFIILFLDYKEESKKLQHSYHNMKVMLRNTLSRCHFTPLISCLLYCAYVLLVDTINYYECT